MDRVSKAQRSENMAKIRGKDTLPELKVRSLLHRFGYRFRLHKKELPGRPDIVLKKHGLVIFVHGCFWHRHKGCKRATTPKTNYEFWQKKFDRNIKRDNEVKTKLESMGWKVVVIWECETKNAESLSIRLNKIFSL